MIEKNEITLCSISNIASGTCLEDCKFCTQSVKYGAKIDRYSRKEISQIVEEAKNLYSLGATGFCLVTAGKGLDKKTLKYVVGVAEKIKNETPNLNLIACNGTATKNDLKELQRAGIGSYNHNLETSKEFYPKICTTHSWNERWETLQNVKEVGLDLCSGGIVGMGENEDDRESMLNSLKELKPESIPINFYHHNEALPLQENPLSIETGFKILDKFRENFPQQRIMVAGGRESFFGERQEEIFSHGINSIVIGNYLTTKGRESHKDLEMLKKLNLKVAGRCEN
jgi:biotin synthase